MVEDASDKASEIKALCLRLLARREHSQQELLFKLQAKGYSKTDSLPIIQQLHEQHWQDDSRFAENYARSCIQRGYGPVYIQYQLRQRGAGELDMDTLEELAGSWQNLLEQVYQKKYGQTPISDKNEKAKRQRFLLQRGFSQAMVNDLLHKLGLVSD
jgi:regulatory protein